MGGGNTAATSTVSPGAAVAVISPRHVHLPDIPLDNNVLFELIVFMYSALVLGLQYVNLYKTVWWLPHSSAHYGLVRCVFFSFVYFILSSVTVCCTFDYIQVVSALACLW